MGEEVIPMYELEIRGADNKAEMNYAQEGIYISDIIVEENMVTLNRGNKRGRNLYRNKSGLYHEQ